MKVDDQLRRLQELRKEEVSEALISEVTKALASASGFVVGKAADVVREKTLRGLTRELVAAFERMVVGGEKKDKGCEGKIAVVKALHELECEEIEVFRRGIRCVQMEGTWGGSVDTGAGVRAVSAVALAQTRYSKVLQELVPLLVDPVARVRGAAAEAIGASARAEGELLLRLKALTGDQEADVVGACLSGVLELGRGSSVPFVAEFLNAKDEVVREVAAFALGSSRLPEAFEVLKSQWKEGIDHRAQEVLITSLATLRDDRAIQFLASLIEDGSPRVATQVQEAMKPFLSDERVRNRIEQAVAPRKPR